MAVRTQIQPISSHLLPADSQDISSHSGDSSALCQSLKKATSRRKKQKYLRTGCPTTTTSIFTTSCWQGISLTTSGVRSNFITEDTWGSSPVCFRATYKGTGLPILQVQTATLQATRSLLWGHKLNPQWSLPQFYVLMVIWLVMGYMVAPPHSPHSTHKHQGWSHVHDHIIKAP